MAAVLGDMSEAAAHGPNPNPHMHPHRPGRRLRFGGREFGTWRDYVRSDYFKDAGKHCATRPRNMRAPGRRSKVASDCSGELTVPNASYAPLARLEVPIVVHLITDAEGYGYVSDAVVAEQIAVLNEDFQALLATPGGNGNDAQIHFVLATQDPAGNSTTGITRTADDTMFADQGSYWNTLAWDPHRYLNIYVNEASGNLGYVPALPQEGIAGSLPDRIVILWSAFGRPGPVGDPYDQGRTLTHEMGHYLGLEHPFADGCGPQNTPECYANGDLICDTGAQAQPTYGCPQSETSCGSLDAVTNYMNYTDDGCMGHFTPEQIRRVRCTLQYYRVDLFSVDTRDAIHVAAPQRFAAPGSVAVYPVRIQNKTLGNALWQIRWQLEGPPVGFEASFAAAVGWVEVVEQGHSVWQLPSLAPGEELWLDAQISVPEAALAGAVATFRIELEQQHNQERVAETRITTTCDTVFALSLAPQRIDIEALPGETARIDINLANTGNIADVFVLDVVSAPIGPFEAHFVASQSAQHTAALPGQSEVLVPFEVAIGSQAQAGDGASFVVYAQGQEGGVHDAIEVHVHAAAVQDATLSPVLAVRQAMPDETVVFGLTLHNRGNAAATYALGWASEDFIHMAVQGHALDTIPRIGPLAAGEEVEIELEATLPAHAAPNVSLIGAVRAYQAVEGDEGGAPPEEALNGPVLAEAHLEVQVQKQMAFALTPSSSLVRVLPGAQAMHGVVVRNLGNVAVDVASHEVGLAYVGPLGLTLEDGSAYFTDASLPAAVTLAPAGEEGDHKEILGAVGIAAEAPEGVQEHRRLRFLAVDPLNPASQVEGDAFWVTEVASRVGGSVAERKVYGFAKPAEMAEHPLLVTNHGNADDRFILRAKALDAPVGNMESRDAFTLLLPTEPGSIAAAGETTTVWARVRVAEGTPAGSQQSHGVAVLSARSLEEVAEAVVVTEASVAHRAVWELDTPWASLPWVAADSGAVRVPITVRNQGNSSDSFILSVQAADQASSPWQLVPNQTEPLAPGAAQEVVLLGQYDPTASAEAPMHIELKAISVVIQATAGDRAAETSEDEDIATLDGQVVAQSSYGVALSIVSAASPIGASTSMPFGLTLTNTGNATDSFILEGQEGAHISQSQIGPMAPGERVYVGAVLHTHIASVAEVVAYSVSQKDVRHSILLQEALGAQAALDAAKGDGCQAVGGKGASAWMGFWLSTLMGLVMWRWRYFGRR